MSDVPPPKNAFEKMMAAEKDPWYTAVLYEAWLEHADPEEPLWRVPYFGQAVRVGTAEAVFKVRKRKHETDAALEDKDLGFHAVIDRFGAKAIVWRIVSFKSGPRSKMQAWANAEEIRLIDENGGILRDMDAKLEQTLNLTKGGQGDARAVWAGIDAHRQRAFNRFKAAMQAYVKEYESSLVPQEYVAANNYPLGVALSNFRQGKMRKGMPEEEEINAWAQALPNFAWNAQRSQQRSVDALSVFKLAMEKYVKECHSSLVPKEYIDADEYPLGMALNNFRQGRWWKGMPWNDETVAWAKALPSWAWNAKKTDEWRKNIAQRMKAQHVCEKLEKKVDRASKTKATMATDVSQTKRRKIALGLRETERRNEIEHARTIAVPFEKSKKRRIQMRKESKHTKPLGCGKKVDNMLYMFSEDGETIRRVAKNGDLGKDQIVGPVVDPPTSEAGPSDLNAYVSDSGSESK